MRTLIIFTFLITLSLASFAQTLKRTFYDFRSTQKAEEYYVNSKGEKHGKYKSYSRNGIVEEEANFKNGYLDGFYIKYNTNSGRQTLISKEIYKDDVLHGEAIYYNGNGLVNRKGNYVNGKKQGDWQYLDIWSLDNGEEPPSNSKYIKSIVTFKDGERVYNGQYKQYYYPSGKLQAVYNFNEGYKVGENISYHTNGKIKDKVIYNESSYPILVITWYSNGNLKSEINYDGKGNQISRVGYTESGEPDELMQRAEYEKQALQEEEERRNQKYLTLISEANQLLQDKLYMQAKTKYQEALNFKSADDYATEKINEIDKALSIIAANKKALKDLDITINSKKEVFMKSFVTEKQSILKSVANNIAQENMLGVNMNTSSLSFPHGKDVYFKLDTVLQELIENYQNEAEENKISKGNKVVQFLDKIIALPNSENSKATFKQVKRTGSTVEVLSLLNL
jgi:antitoxin component YwqK of YwqJK toxin-antitoxin module